MSSVAQILDRSNSDQTKERAPFQQVWSTAHAIVVKEDGTIVEGISGFALDEYEGHVVAEVRKSNNFPVPRYDIFVGIRKKGRNIASVSLRTSIEPDAKVAMDTAILSNLTLAYAHVAQWAQNDLAEDVARPNVQKAIQNRLRRQAEEQGSNGGIRKTGKTERDRAKKQNRA